MLGNGLGSRTRTMVEFKAGRCDYTDGWVRPDKRKGMVTLLCDEDSLVHFQWKERRSRSVDQDNILFPGDAVVEKVSTCTTGRVILLKFTSDRKLFFWMQEPKDDKDEEILKKINDGINGVSVSNTSSSGVASSGGADQNEIMNLLSALNNGSMSNEAVGSLLQRLQQAEADEPLLRDADDDDNPSDSANAPEDSEMKEKSDGDAVFEENPDDDDDLYGE